ncbi:MAG: protein kinase [Pirellulaceae bacterium]
MGQVFKGVHRLMGRECAVKVLPRARATADSLENFRREIRMQAGLDCPIWSAPSMLAKTARYTSWSLNMSRAWTCSAWSNLHCALPVQQASKIIMQAALGLDYAHRQGMVHRDVKPGNILVTPTGEAKVSDVGLAGFAKDFINDPRAGKIVGTTDYISPEQIRTPLEIHAASDIYSWLHALLRRVAKFPFPAAIRPPNSGDT